MFKVITPIERKDGGRFWMRLGNAYVNKDNSINVYLDAVPLVPGRDGQGVTLQLRELTDDELRERAEKRATYASRSSLSPLNPPSPASGGVDAVPF
jgi:hypothetical protein